MVITYIGHSGFLIEWENCYWLFDYYRGEIPELKKEKKIIVFASHKHQDHFNPAIFDLQNKYLDIQYVLSSDIKLNSGITSRNGVVEMATVKILSVKPMNQYELTDKDNNILAIKTLKSTDCGVAFLIRYLDQTIYHAGDLNLWLWKEESKQYNHNMQANFDKAIQELKDVSIDVAFTPLDPRQEEYYYLGLESLLSTAIVSNVFPMHFWDKPSLIQQFKKERNYNTEITRIFDVNKEGEQWTM